MSGLFRREALDHAARRLTGEVVLATPLSVRLLGTLLCLVLVVAAGFALFATYARKETVQGWIVPEGGLIRVVPREAGVIVAVNVAEGDAVRADQPLATLRLSTNTVAGNSSAAMSRDIAAEARANDAAVSAARAKLAHQAGELHGRRQALQAELGAVHERLQSLAQRQALAEQQVQRGEALKAKGFLAQSSLESLKASALAAAQDASEIRAAAMSYQRQIGDVEQQLLGLPSERAALDAQAAQTRALMSQRSVSLDTQTNLVATAPVDGEVVALPVETGQSLGAGASIAILSPRGSRLIAELYVPSRAAGFIKVGQDVRLMYQAFPYQRFGAGVGVVEAVSRTVLASNEVAIPGLAGQEPVFRVRVRLLKPSVAAYGQDMPLRPGMLLTADLVIDRRTLVEWLLDPLYAAGRRA